MQQLKKNYLLRIRSPILFTAPHSKRLLRGGIRFGQKQRVHSRQIYTSYLCVAMEESYCVWGKSSSLNPNNIDPNYMLEQLQGESPFHQSLHKWGLSCEGIPLHIDLHGKMNRANNCKVDVGMRSMQVHWQNHPLIAATHAFFQANNQIFQGRSFRTHTCVFDTNPDLHGYWGDKVRTMTEQAILLNIPSIQLEIPFQVRASLYKHPAFRRDFQNVLMRYYKEVVCPVMNEYPRKLRVSQEIAARVQINVEKNNQKEVKNAFEMYQNKQQAILNGKYI